MGRRKHYGFSFSWKRAVGISAAKGKISRATGIPLTRAGRQRKVGKALGCCLPLVLAALVLLCLFVSLHAQEMPKASADSATVYVYQLHHVRTLGRVAPPVFIDEREVAKLDGQRYFVAHLPAGTHSFRSKDKNKGGVEFELKAGGVYYVRMDMQEGSTVHGAHMVHVPDESGTYEIKEMRPIARGDIKDASIVETEYPEK